MPDITEGIRYNNPRNIDGNGMILITNPSDPATGGYVTENQLKEWISGDVPEEIESLGQRVSAAEGDIETLEGKVDTIDGKVDAVEEDVDAIEDKVTAIESTDIDQQRRISSLEFDVMDLQSALDGISQVEFKRETKSGSFDVPTPDKGTLANSAEVVKVNGDTIKSKNLFNPNMDFASGWYNDSGVFTESQATWHSVDVLPVEGGASYMLSGNTWDSSVGNNVVFNIYFYKGDTFFGRSNNIVSDETKTRIDIPSGVTGVRFQVSKAHANFASEIARIQFEKGSVATPFEPYFDGLKDAENIVVESVGANLWDEQTRLGYYDATGTYVDRSDIISSKNPIYVKASADYTIVCQNRMFVTQWASDGSFISRVEAKSLRTDARCAYIHIQPYEYGYTYNHDIAIFEGSKDKPYEPYKHDSITIPISLKKGDVYEPSTGMISETWKKVTVAPSEWAYNGSELSWQHTLSDVAYATNDGQIMPPMVCDKYTVDTAYNVTHASTQKAGTISISGNGQYLRCFTGSSADRPTECTVCYQLAEPIAPHKVTEPILNNLSVWEGGQISVTSEGAQAEAEVSFRLNYNVDTRLQDLETEVSQQNLRITNLEYENRIVKAVIKKKIAEETEMTGNVIQFPTSEGYPLADWGELKRLKGKTWAWNQLATNGVFTSRNGINTTNDGVYSVLNSDGATLGNASGWFGLSTDGLGDRWRLGDIYMYGMLVVGGTYDGNIKFFLSTDETDGFNRIAVTKARAVGGIGNISNVSWGNGFKANNLKVFVILVNATTLFGVTETTQVTETMKSLVRAYAEAHPSYDAGSLVSAVYERGVSIGRNVIPTEGWVVGAIDNTTGADKTDGTVCRSDYIPIEGNPNRFYLTSVNDAYIWIHFYDSSRQWISGQALYHWIKGNGSSYYASVPSNAKYIRVRTTAYYGQEYNGDICVSELKEDGVIPYSSQTLDLSFLNSVPNIGIEGTEIDFEREEVRWSHWKVRFVGDANEEWYWYGENHLVYVNGINPPSINGQEYASVCNRFAHTMGSFDTASENLCHRFQFGTPSSRIYFRDDSFNSVADFKASLNTRPIEVLYILATPITKTFAELGITIPPSWDGGKPWIRVEAGGTFTVVSTGAPAEATVSFLTNLGGNA